MRILSGRLKSVDRLAFSPDSTLLVTAGGERNPIELLSTTGADWPPRRLPVRPDRTLWSFAFNPVDGSLVVAADTSVVGFEPDTGTELWRVEPEAAFVLAGIDISRDGRHMAVGFLYQYLSDDGYQFWELNGRRPPKRRRTVNGSSECMCRGVTFVRDDLVAFAEYDPAGGPALVNLIPTSPGPGQLIETTFRRTEQLAASPDGGFLAGLYPKAVAVWNVATPQVPPARVPATSRYALTGVAFHPSGRFLAATSNDATVKLYDTATWQVAKAYTWDVGRMRSVAFSPDGTLAAAGSDTGKVVVWDVDV